MCCVRTDSTLAIRRVDAVELTGAWLASKRSPNTRRAYGRDVLAFGRWLAGGREASDRDALSAAATASVADVVAWRDALAEQRSPATVARRVAALRAWYRALVAAELRSTNPASIVEVDTVHPDDQRRPWVERPVVRRMLASASERDRLIIGLCACLGLRRSEIASLRVADFDAARRELVVRGKGQSIRSVQTRPCWIAASLALACAGRGRRDRIVPVSVERIGQIVRRAARRAGAPGTVGPHALRRTMATLYLDDGGSIEHLRRTLGHADTRTTGRYDRRRAGDAHVDYGED